MFETDDGRKIDVPEGLTLEEERAVFMAQILERLSDFVLDANLLVHALDRGQRFGRGRVALEPWHGQWVEFARKGVAPVHGRSDVQ